MRSLADRHGVHRGTIRTALTSPAPRPRKTMSRRGSRLDQYQAVIDGMLTAPRRRRGHVTIKEIYDLLGERRVSASYSAVAAYVRTRRESLTGHPDQVVKPVRQPSLR